MPGFVIPSPKFTALSDTGATLSGALLYSYASGTSTPKATYSDQGLTTPNANPTVCDSAGRAEVWIEDGESYKFVLKDSAGVTIWTVDNVSVPAIAAAATPSEVPSGGIIMYGGAAAPTGFLLCDGSAVSRTTYAALFAVISTTFGAGNGSTTFNLPDMRGKFPLGVAASGTGNVLGGTGGTIDHVHAGPSHTHTVAAHTHTLAHTHAVSRDGWGGVVNAGAVPAGRLLAGDGAVLGLCESQNDGASGAASTPNTGGAALTSDAGGTANTGTGNPPFCALSMIIKT